MKAPIGMPPEATRHLSHEREGVHQRKTNESRTGTYQHQYPLREMRLAQPGTEKEWHRRRSDGPPTTNRVYTKGRTIVE